MYKRVTVLLLQYICLGQARFLPANISSTESAINVVEEIQHAICKISSADLDATANATITRQLKGVCTSSYLDERINILEKTLILEINSIKYSLKQSLNSMHTLEEQTKSNIVKTNLNQMPPIIRRKNTDRDFEIGKFNMTTQKQDNIIKFNYYWKIKKITLSSVDPRNSGDFYFGGNHIYMQIFPNYLQSEQLFIKIIALEEFDLTYRFSVLDQEDEEFDIMSQLLYCGLDMKCPGYKISHSILLNQNYVKDNCLLIKRR